MEQLQLSGDRLDICALDGNAKLHRRTCGQPFAEAIHCPIVNKYLLRHCSRTPGRRDTLCREHAAQRDCQPAVRWQIGRHRLRHTRNQSSTSPRLLNLPASFLLLVLEDACLSDSQHFACYCQFRWRSLHPANLDPRAFFFFLMSDNST